MSRVWQYDEPQLNLEVCMREGFGCSVLLGGAAALLLIMLEVGPFLPVGTSPHLSVWDLPLKLGEAN